MRRRAGRWRTGRPGCGRGRFGGRGWARAISATVAFTAQNRSAHRSCGGIGCEHRGRRPPGRRVHRDRVACAARAARRRRDDPRPRPGRGIERTQLRRPPPFAARLASGRTATVGLVVPFVNRWFFAEVIAAVETELRRAGLDLLLYNLGDLAGRAQFFDVMPMRKRVDARARRESGARGLRVRRAGRAEPPGRAARHPPRGPACRPGSTTSPPRGRRSITSCSWGHRRIGLIGGDTDDPMRFTPPLHTAATATATRCEAVGIEPTRRWSTSAISPSTVVARPPVACWSGADPADRGVRRERRDGLRSAPRGRSARVCAPPHDLAVVGFDDQPLSPTSWTLPRCVSRSPIQALDVTTRMLALIAEGDPADRRPRPARPPCGYRPS